MRIAIRFGKTEEIKALPILLRRFSGMVLPDRVYVLNDSAIAALRKEGIRFEVLAAEETLARDGASETII